MSDINQLIYSMYIDEGIFGGVKSTAHKAANYDFVPAAQRMKQKFKSAGSSKTIEGAKKFGIGVVKGIDKGAQKSSDWFEKNHPKTQKVLGHTLRAGNVIGSLTPAPIGTPFHAAQYFVHRKQAINDAKFLGKMADKGRQHMSKVAQLTHNPNRDKDSLSHESEE